MSTFNYQALAPTTASEVSMATERIKLRMRRTAEDIVAIGQDLTMVKQRLEHGEFLSWIKSEFEMSERTSQNFMQVAETFGSKSAKIADLKPSIIYALASAPEAVQDQVVERVKSGESVSAKEIRELKQKAKDAEEKARKMEALAKERQAEISRLQTSQESIKQDLDHRASQIQSLSQKIAELQAAEPTIIEKEKIVEVIPDEYASLEEAIAASHKQLATLEEEQRKAQKKLQSTREGVKVVEAEYQRKEQQVQQQMDFRGLYREHRNNVAEYRQHLTILCQLAPALIASFNQGIIDPEIDQTMLLSSEFGGDEVLCEILSAWQQCRDRNSQSEPFIDVIAS